MERFDDVHLNRGEPPAGERWFLHNSDCIEILVDGDHGGDRFFPTGSFWPAERYQGEDKLLMNVRAQRWVAAPEPIDFRVQGGNRLGLLPARVL